MKTLVVVPTFNERENIGRLVPQILTLGSQIEVLVVDDNSPDDTAGLILAMQKELTRLHLLQRPSKQGLGSAYREGFNWGLAREFEAIFEMDADFSHRPQDLATLMSALAEEGTDFVIGSRYVDGGQTVNWGRGRLLISRGGSFYARRILGYPIRDWTGGFNGWRSRVLSHMKLETLKSEGYSFQIELKYRALKSGFQHREVPIVFEDRRVGQSKMSAKIMLEALYRVWLMR